MGVVQKAILVHPKLTISSKLLYCYIASHGAVVTTTKEDIAKSLNVKSSSIDNAMSQLCSFGLLSVQLGQQMSITPHHILEEQEVKLIKQKTDDLPSRNADFDMYLDILNRTLNKRYRGNQSVKSKFAARLKDGFTLKDFEEAITNASKTEFHSGNKYMYLTPEFFTRPDKLDMYLNLRGQVKKVGTDSFGQTNLLSL